MFYTTTGKPKTFSTLRQHILHRLYTTPPALHPQPSSPVAQFTNTAKSNSQFPFPFRANQLDRDSIMIPAGWDSWGKIEILKEGFSCQQVNGLWDTALGREAQRYNQKNGRNVSDGLLQDEDDEGIQQIWQDVIPDPTNDAHVSVVLRDQQTRVAPNTLSSHRQTVTLPKRPGARTSKTFSLVSSNRCSRTRIETLVVRFGKRLLHLRRRRRAGTRAFWVKVSVSVELRLGLSGRCRVMGSACPMSNWPLPPWKVEVDQTTACRRLACREG